MGKGDIDKFKGEGFHTWQTKIKGYLMKKCLWVVISPPVEMEIIHTRASSSQLREKDQQALGIIITALDDAYIHYIDDASTAKEAWNLLEKMFGAKGKHSRIGLKMDLYKIVLLENEDIASLINRLKSIITQLVYIQVQVDEEDKVAILLSALPDEYSQLVTVLKEKELVPPLEEVINSIQDEAKKINKQKGKHDHEASTSQGAYVVTKASCTHCGKDNHKSKDCYKIKTCHHCGKTGHAPNRCYFKDKAAKDNKNKGKGRVNYIEEGDGTMNIIEEEPSPSYELYDDIL